MLENRDQGHAATRSTAMDQNFGVKQGFPADLEV